MYIRWSVQSDKLTLRNSLNRRESFNYAFSGSSLPDLSNNPKPTGNDNGVSLGIVRFCIVLGGILFIIIITGIVTYIYRKKLLRSRPRKPPKTNTISYILDYYEHDYIEPKKNNIVINKSNISVPTWNEDVQQPITVSQISAPMPNSSVSIYNKERANSLASNLATRSVDATTITPPIPARTSDNNKKLKTISRESEKKTVSNATSFDNINIIPEMFDDSTETTTTPIDINAKWFTYPIDSPTIPLTPSLVPITSENSSRPPSEESDSIFNIPGVNRKSKRNLRIRIDTFDQFKLNKDNKTTYTSVGTSTHDIPESESKGDKDKEDRNNHEDKNKSVKMDLSKMTYDERSRSFGTPIKSNQHKRNGNIFEYKLIRSKTVI